MNAIIQRLRTVPALLLGALLLGSCGVTGPDDSPWQNVGDFSWPTQKGTMMKFRTTEDATVFDSDVEVDVSDDDPSNPELAFHNGQRMYMLRLTKERDVVKDSIITRPDPNPLRFLPLEDTLIVKNDQAGIAYALVSPLVKGHRWVASYDNGLSGKDTTMMAEIIELFSFRKVEGKMYENVVAVKYWRLKPPPLVNVKEEWIRFYAQGVGEITTIRSIYPSESGVPDPLPLQQERKVLLETSAVN